MCGRAYSEERIPVRPNVSYQPDAGAASVARGGALSLCAFCGLLLHDDQCLCPHHHNIYGDSWAVFNRLMCNLVHRSESPPGLPEAERWEDEVVDGCVS